MFDTSGTYEANLWLLEKIQAASQSELSIVCTTLYGIWYWRNKQVWEGKIVPGNVAIECSMKMVQDWKNAIATGKK